MAELFENMEKLDIQAERRNTEEQRQRAEIAEQKANASIALLVKSCQAMGMSIDATQLKLMEGLNLDKEETSSIIQRYWNF